jgi:hypothetical protein
MKAEIREDYPNDTMNKRISHDPGGL